MHVHGNHLNPAAMNLYAAITAETAAAAKRAADVRKKLISSAASIEAELDDGGVSMIGRESEEDSGQREEQEHPPAKAKSDSGDEDSPSAPVSVWG